MIKRFLEFINERRLLESVDDNLTYKLDKSDLEDMTLAMADMDIDMEYTFTIAEIKDAETFFPLIESYESLVKPGHFYSPAYIIEFLYMDNIDYEEFRTDLSVLVSNLEAEYIVGISQGSNKIESVDDIIFNGNPLRIYFAEKEVNKMTPVKFAEIYEIRDASFTDKGSMYVDISYEDMANMILRNKDYINYIEEGYIEYYNYGDNIDTKGLVQYYLNKENIKSLVEIVIDAIGFDDFKEEYLDKDNIEEVVNYLTDDTLRGRESGERDKILIKISDDDNIDSLMIDIKNIYDDMYINSLSSKNYNELINAFENEVNKHYQTDEIIKNYKKYFRIFIDYEIFDYFDLPDNPGYTLQDILDEWHNRNVGTEEINPRFSDYGDVDKKIFNEEVRGVI